MVRGGSRCAATRVWTTPGWNDLGRTTPGWNDLGWTDLPQTYFDGLC